VIQRVRERRLTQEEAARMLGLGVRQVQRLCAAYRDRGAAGLVSGKRGRQSNRRLPDERRRRAMELVRARYADFGPTFAAEKLAELHELTVRRRRPCRGELVQIDGSDHAWFEERGPRCTLLVFIDDATSELMELRFAESESTFSYFEALRAYLERHGKPVALYSDKASVFRPTGPEAKGVSQFGRALAELNIDILCANTPAAKGRVERSNLTLQDRLAKEMRLRGISTLEDGNAYLEEYRTAHNAKFAVAPASEHDAHRPLLDHDDLDKVFTWQEERTLSKNLTLHYRKKMLMVTPSPETTGLVRRRGRIYEWDDGHLEVVCDGRALPFTLFDKNPYVDQGEVVENKRLGAAMKWVEGRQEKRDEARLKDKKVSLREKKWIRQKSPAQTRIRP